MTINMAVKEKLMLILLEGLLIYREMALVNVDVNSFKRQPHKMVKHAQTICRLLPTNCLSVFDHFVALALKRLTYFSPMLYFV